MTKTIRLFLFFLFCVYAPTELFAAVHAVSVSGSGSANGTNWSNAFAGLPGTLTRGDIYYLADGTYSSYTFNTATSGTTVSEIRKAQSYDFGGMSGWNTATMGSAQAIMPDINVQGSYLTINGNGTLTVPGCGGAPAATMTTTPPPTPTDCGIAFNGSGAQQIFINGAQSNLIVKYVEFIGTGNNGTETFIIFNGAGGGGSSLTVNHTYGHNAGCVYIQDIGNNSLVSFSYFWGTQSGSCHGQAEFEVGGTNNGVRHDNVLRDILGTAIWTFAQSGTGTANNWQFYNNVIWHTTTSTGQAQNGVIACINSGVQCTNFTYVQNTVINCHYACGILDENGNGSYTIENNLWYLNKGDGGGGSAGSPGGIPSLPGTEDHNSAIQSGSSSIGGGTGNVVDASGPNPFVNWPNGNFNIASENSDWTNRVSLGAPYTVDVAGTTFTTDRGAYQFVSAALPIPAPAPVMFSKLFNVIIPK